LFAVTAMLITYALENRSNWFILAFAGACVMGSAYGFLQGAWPFWGSGGGLGSGSRAAVVFGGAENAILSKADDPLLPPASVDAVLLLKTYHEIADPVALLEHLRPALRPGARVGIIDPNGNGTDHRIGSKIVVEEAEKAGYRRLETYDFVKGDAVDYFLVFGVR
jgi:SAM-dependent methyltransferase